MTERTPLNELGKDARTWLMAPPFRHEGPFGWVGTLPAELHLLTDGNEEPARSPLHLYEDESALGPGHALHDSIQRKGGGCYSFWGNVVYFSTSDGSNPNRNGRSYVIALPDGQRHLGPVDTRELSRPTWVAPDRTLKCALFGMGNRGVALALMARRFEGLEVTWVIDQSNERLAEASRYFGPSVKVDTEPEQALADGDVDIAIVAVPDSLHRQFAVAAFEAGKHVFLEKPIATTANDAFAIIDAWQHSGRILQLGYVLRQAPFYAAIKEVVVGGILGEVRIATLSEQLAVRHGASFMRRWHAQSRMSGGLLVHKGCHDLDILCWMLNARPRILSSFGGLDTFKRSPPAEFCSQCGERHVCPYVDTGLHERRAPAEAQHPSSYGLDRCVFRTDKDIVDNQVVTFELDNGVRGSFCLAMQGPGRSERRITLMGDRARLDGTFEDSRFVITFTDGARPPFVWTGGSSSKARHGGGDQITMAAFLNAATGRASPPVATAEDAIRGLIFALAAERARKEQTVVVVDDADFSPSAGARNGDG